MSIAVLNAPESPSPLEVLKDQHRQVNLNENRLKQLSSFGSTSDVPTTTNTTNNNMVISVEEPTFKYKVSGGTATTSGNGNHTMSTFDWKSGSLDDGGLGDTTDDGGALPKSNSDKANKNVNNPNRYSGMTVQEIEALRRSEQSQRRKERKKNRELRKQREKNKNNGDIGSNSNKSPASGAQPQGTSTTEVTKSPPSPRRMRLSSGVVVGMEDQPVSPSGRRRRPSASNKGSSSPTKRPSASETTDRQQQHQEVSNSPRRRNQSESVGKKIASPGSKKREVFISPIDPNAKDAKKGSLLAKYLPPVSSLDGAAGAGTTDKRNKISPPSAGMAQNHQRQQQHMGKTNDHFDAESVNTLGSVPRVVTISPSKEKGKSDDGTVVSRLTTTNPLPRIPQNIATDGASTVASDIFSTAPSQMMNGKKDNGRKVVAHTKLSDASMDDSIMSEDIDDSGMAIPTANVMDRGGITSTRPGEPTHQQEEHAPATASLGNESSTIISLQSKLEKLERDKQIREEELMEELERAQEEASGAKKDGSEASSRVQTLESIVERLRKQNKELVDTHKVEVMTMSLQFDEKSKELINAQQQVKSMTTKVSDLEKENKQLLSAKDTNKSGDSKELSEYRQTIVELRKELAEVKATSKQLDNGGLVTISLSKDELDSAFEDGINAKKAFMVAQQSMEIEKGKTAHVQLTAATLREIDARRRRRESVHTATMEKLKEDHKAREYLLGRTLVFYRAEGEQAKKGVEEAKHCVSLYQKVIEELQGGIKELTNRRNEENEGVRIQLALIQDDLSNFAATLSEDVEVPTMAQGIFVNALRKIKMLQKMLEVGPEQEQYEGEEEYEEHYEMEDDGDESSRDEEDDEIDEEDEDE